MVARAGADFLLHCLTWRVGCRAATAPGDRDVPTKPKQTIPDPNNVPVTHVTGFISNIYNGQTIAMNFVTDQMAIYPDGSGESELIVAARLRFDLNVAVRIRDQLNVHLASLAATLPPGEKAN